MVPFGDGRGISSCALLGEKVSASARVTLMASRIYEGKVHAPAHLSKKKSVPWGSCKKRSKPVALGAKLIIEGKNSLEIHYRSFWFPVHSKDLDTCEPQNRFFVFLFRFLFVKGLFFLIFFYFLLNSRVGFGHFWSWWTMRLQREVFAYLKDSFINRLGGVKEEVFG